jgi:virulence-associated protein VagC
MTSRKDERLVIAPIGEYYNDLLTVDSWIRDTTKSQQASSLLASKLQEREQRIKERIEYLAKKRGITSDELWINILKGTAEKISASDISFDNPS